MAKNKRKSKRLYSKAFVGEAKNQAFEKIKSERKDFYSKFYYPYYYANTRHLGETYIRRALNTLHEKCIRQLNQFNKDKQDVVLDTNTLTGVDKVLSLLLEGNGDMLEEVLATSPSLSNEVSRTISAIIKEILDETDGMFSKVNTAYNAIKTFNEKDNQSISAYCNNINRFFESIGLDMKMMDAYGKYLVDIIKQEAETKGTTLNQAAKAAKKRLKISTAAHDRKGASVATLIIDDWMSKTRYLDGLYESIPKNEEFRELDSQLTPALKRLLVQATSLQAFEGSASFVVSNRSYTVVHSNKTTNKLSGDDIGSAIWYELMKKNESSLRSYVASTVKEAVLARLLNDIGSVIYGVANNIDKSIANSFKKVGTKQGFVSIGVEGRQVSNEIMEKFFGTSGQTLDSISRVTNKSDIYLTEYGFSIKELESFGTKKNDTDKRVGITLLNNSPLSTLIAREAGLGSSGIRSTLLLALGKGVDEGPKLANKYSGPTRDELYSLWDQWKTGLTVLGFMNALTGFATSNTKKAYSMIVNDRIYQMESILERFYNKVFQDGGPSLGSIAALQKSRGNDDGLDKATYEKINKWGPRKNSRANMGRAKERSERVYGDAAKILYRTKIRIMLNAALLHEITK